MKRILICVILFEKKPSESATLCSLASRGQGLEDKLDLLIWDNSFCPIEEDELAWIEANCGVFNVTVKQCGNNRSLAQIYNQCINPENYGAHCFLDHDSELSGDYLETIQACDYDVLVPHIIVGNKLKGPKYKNEVVPEDLKLDDYFGGLRAILSGLTIGPKLVSIMRAEYGDVFDERYALYGVDSSFFLRLDHLCKTEKLTIRVASSIGHSLSRLEKESKEIKKMRRRERGWDLGITLRSYPSSSALFAFCREAAKSALLKPTVSWYFVLLGLIEGRHPRSLTK